LIFEKTKRCGSGVSQYAPGHCGCQRKCVTKRY
jgi:hypothetical protein